MTSVLVNTEGGVTLVATGPRREGVALVSLKEEGVSLRSAAVKEA